MKVTIDYFLGWIKISDPDRFVFPNQKSWVEAIKRLNFELQAVTNRNRIAFSISAMFL